MPLSIEQLAAFGLPEQAVDVWRSNGVRELLPLQERALAEHGFLHGKSLLVLAPTSSGKTFIAEMAALKHLDQNRRVVYLVPTKALAEEKYRAFVSLYGPLGFRIAISTRERPDADALVLGGRYDLLVAVYEKMKAYLVTQPEILSGVALVVADEIQMLGETGRGATIDLLLTKIRRAPYRTQFVGLSAVLGEDASRLAAWLGCDLMVYRQRPLELREGVFDFSRSAFRYRCFNTGEYGEEIVAEEQFGPPDETDSAEEPADFRREAILSLAQKLAADWGEQVLIFVPTRYASRNWAHHLAARVELPCAQAVLEEISEYEDTLSRDLLREVLEHGVAFHNADLSWDLRALIEHHFNSGAIRVLVSTSTLGQGVNLTGRNVLHVPVMVTTDPWTGRTTCVALSRSRFRNQGGRGARFGRGDDFGRSILVARNRMEAERLMRDYVEGESENLTPQLDPDSLDMHLLDLIASRVATTPSALSEFFLQTFSGRTLWQADSAAVARRIEDIVVALTRHRLVATTDENKLTATGIGEVAAATGLHYSTVDRVVTWLREEPRVLTHDPIEALVVLAATRDGRDFPIGAAGVGAAGVGAAAGGVGGGEAAMGGGDSAAAWVEPLRERLLGCPNGMAPMVEGILFPAGGLTREMLLDFKKALLLDAWIGPADTRDIEERFQVYSGTVANLAGHFAWLAQAACALARALVLPAEYGKALEALGERLALGCGPEGLRLRSLRVQGLSRAYLQALLREGYDSLPALADARAEDLSRFIPARIAREVAAEAYRLVHPGESRAASTKSGKTEGIAEPGRESPKTTVSKTAADTHSKTAADTQPRGTAETGRGRKGTPAARTEIEESASTRPPASSSKRGGPAEVRAAGGILLEIDLRGTGRAKLNGRDLNLSPLPFRLLAYLARFGENGAAYVDIEQNVWIDAHVERQQIHSHRAAVVEAFGAILPPKQAHALIRVKRGIGLYLALKPHQIRIISA